MIDCRYQDDNNKLNKLESDMYDMISKKIKISLLRMSTEFIMLHDGYDIRDIYDDIQGSVYKRINEIRQYRKIQKFYYIQ